MTYNVFGGTLNLAQSQFRTVDLFDTSVDMGRERG